MGSTRTENLMWTNRRKARLTFIISTDTHCDSIAYRSFRSAEYYSYFRRLACSLLPPGWSQPTLSQNHHGIPLPCASLRVHSDFCFLILRCPLLLSWRRRRGRSLQLSIFSEKSLVRANHPALCTHRLSRLPIEWFGG